MASHLPSSKMIMQSVANCRMHKHCGKQVTTGSYPCWRIPFMSLSHWNWMHRKIIARNFGYGLFPIWGTWMTAAVSAFKLVAELDKLWETDPKPSFCLLPQLARKRWLFYTGPLRFRIFTSSLQRAGNQTQRMPNLHQPVLHCLQVWVRKNGATKW